MKKLLRTLLVLFLLNLNVLCIGQLAGNNKNTTRLSFIFAGDIMGHSTQIMAAYDKKTGRYQYDSCFKYLKPVLAKADFAIANFEVTLAGEPYTGYPRFSSPDALALASKNAGFNCLVTANNHCYDRGGAGLVRTLNVLDLLDIKHTGTFRNDRERLTNNPLIFQKNGIKVALLNYTYGTNGLKVPAPLRVNRIDKHQIAVDVQKAKLEKADQIILFFHWGTEYQTLPGKHQKDLANFCDSLGVGIVIGSHPHVVQPMEWYPEKSGTGTELIAWSLGNLISNQRKENTDGGAMIRFTLRKDSTGTRVSDAGFFLTWVYRLYAKGKSHFFVLPVYEFENRPVFFSTKEDFGKMKRFIKNTGTLLEENNKDIGEY